MKRFTQTNTESGNCWQTAVASILEIEPDRLPCQVTIERAGVSYLNSLNSYLILHHGLVYGEIYEWQFSALRPRADRHNGYHCLVGPTARTPINHFKHVVVGRFGRQVWDVHPSRDGLTHIERWGTMGDAREDQRDGRSRQLEDDSKHGLSMTCLCSECMGDTKRNLLERFLSEAS